MVYKIFVAKHSEDLPWVIWDGETFHRASHINSCVPFMTEEREAEGPVARYVILVNGTMTLTDNVALFT